MCCRVDSWWGLLLACVFCLESVTVFLFLSFTSMLDSVLVVLFAWIIHTLVETVFLPIVFDVWLDISSRRGFCQLYFLFLTLLLSFLTSLFSPFLTLLFSPFFALLLSPFLTLLFSPFFTLLFSPFLTLLFLPIGFGAC